MKSFFIYVCVFALIGGALCRRSRRQAIPADVIPADVDVAAADGATPPPPPSTADKLNGVVAGLILEQQNKAALGMPVDPKDLDKILKLSMVIGIVGGDLSAPNQDALEQLLTAPAEPDPSAV